MAKHASPPGMSIFKLGPDQNRRDRPYRVSYRDHTGRRRQRVLYTDLGASMAEAWKMRQSIDRRSSGLVDPVDDHVNTPIDQHLAAFITNRQMRNRSAAYVTQLERRINRVLVGIGATTFGDLDVAVVEAFLMRDIEGDRTRNEYITSLKTFVRWAVKSRRLRFDPLAALELTEANRLRRRHRRRALRREEVRALLSAAAERPLFEAETIRRGARKGEQGAKVRPAIRERLILLGKERWLAYLIALWTGLRRSEINALRWSDVHLDAQPPHIRLRAETTKSRRADTVVIHNELAEELHKRRRRAGALDTTVVSRVPSTRVVHADLAHAGIARVIERDGEQVVVDFHALRMTLSTMMAAEGLPQRIRQAHMRHADPRLTDVTYIDDTLLPMHDQLQKMDRFDSAEARGCMDD